MLTKYIIHILIQMIGAAILTAYLLPIIGYTFIACIACGLVLILVMVLVDYLFIGAL